MLSLADSSLKLTVFKSGYLPKMLGILLMIECFGWMLYPFQFFLFPNDEVILYLVLQLVLSGNLALRCSF